MIVRQISRLAALLVVLWVPLNLQAQTTLPIQVDVSHATFAYGADQSLVELYMAFDAASLDYSKEEDVFAAHVPLDIALVRSTTADLSAADDQAVWRDSLLLRFPVMDTTMLSAGQHFIHQIRAAVPPGEYELRLAIPSIRGAERPELELRRDVLVPNYAEKSDAALSDITLATGIDQSDSREDPFYKNGLIIRPNANQLFGQSLQNLYYYAEAYGVDDLSGADDHYTVFAYVSEANRAQPLQNLQKRSDREAREPDVLVGHFDVSALPSGSYFLRVALLNDHNEAVVEQSQKFFVYNPNVERQQPSALEMEFETSPYATMTTEEVETAIEHVSVIGSESERRRLRRIEDLDEKRRALMEFWQKRDAQPNTPINEFKEEFYRRLQYANDRYSSNRRDGWQTDRGRVVIKYGMPTSVEPHLYEREMRPYEIWNYNTIPGEGQAVFVFADLNGFGRFELIHSTVTGERSVPNWQDELTRR